MKNEWILISRNGFIMIFVSQLALAVAALWYCDFVIVAFSWQVAIVAALSGFGVGIGGINLLLFVSAWRKKKYE